MGEKTNTLNVEDFNRLLETYQLSNFKNVKTHGTDSLGATGYFDSFNQEQAFNSVVVMLDDMGFFTEEFYMAAHMIGKTKNVDTLRRYIRKHYHGTFKSQK